jgi:hypothetical protein
MAAAQERCVSWERAGCTKPGAVHKSLNAPFAPESASPSKISARTTAFPLHISSTCNLSMRTLTARYRAVLSLWQLSLLFKSAVSQTPVDEPWAFITTFPAYANLRRCAADCLYKDCQSDPVCEASEESIDVRLHCDEFLCVCQQEKISSISAPISSCVMAGCSAKGDAEVAWDAFTSYCYKHSPRTGEPVPPTNTTSQ